MLSKEDLEQIDKIVGLWLLPIYVVLIGIFVVVLLLLSRPAHATEPTPVAVPTAIITAPQAMTRAVYLAPDGTVLTSATGAIRLLLVGPDNEVLKVIAVPTPTATATPNWKGDTHAK